MISFNSPGTILQDTKNAFYCENFGLTSDEFDVYLWLDKIRVQVQEELVMAEQGDLSSLNLLLDEELYAKLFHYTLKEGERKKLGFPYESKTGKIKSKVVFQNSANPAEQLCRCGKKVSLLEHKWFFDCNGCFYHPGKRVFEGPTAIRFDCCSKESGSVGCAYSKYHVASFHSLEKGFVKAKSKPAQDNSHSSNIYALDCEMVYTVEGLEVARVSLVSVGRKIVFDTFVQPQNKILDFNTRFSGITFTDLQNVSTTLKDVQGTLLELINPETILIGHGLENDLLGLNLIHENVIDTSFVFPHQNGFPFRQSLKALALKHLGKNITKHDSVQDAETCMELILLKVLSNGDESPPDQSFTTMSSVNPSLPKYFSRPPAVPYPPFYYPPNTLATSPFTKQFQNLPFKPKVPPQPTSFIYLVNNQYWSNYGVSFYHIL